MKVFERVVWVTLLLVALVAFGWSMLWAHHQQDLRGQETYMTLMSRVRLMQFLEAEDWEQAIYSNRLFLTSSVDSYIAQYEEGTIDVDESWHKKVMSEIRSDFPELLPAEYRVRSKVAD